MAWEQTGSDDNRFEMTLSNTPAGATLARRQVVRFVEHVCYDRSIIGDLETAVGEALANSAEHGHRPGGHIRVQARLTARGIEVVVADDGRGFEQPLWTAEPPPVPAPRGYGLFLMRAMVDEVEFRDHGRSVRLLKCF